MLISKFLECLGTILFLSYNLIIFQNSFGQGTVEIYERPVSIEVPSFINARATGSSWTQVIFEASATTPSSDNIPVYCTPGSGSAFPMGRTTVVCAAKDPVTNLFSYAMFNVTVTDTTPPAFKVPHSIFKKADNLQGAKITYNANASDAVDGKTITSCDPPSGSIFPIGLNQVTCRSIDGSGNIANASFSVIIKETNTSISNVETNTSISNVEYGISNISRNITNQQLPSEVTVGKNISNGSPHLLKVLENDTESSNIDIQNNEIQSMFEILIGDLK